MKLIQILLLACALSLAPGCALLAPKSDVTWEASRYLSFRDVWTVTHTSYQAMKDREAAGKVNPDDARDIDAAWNTFRAAYLVALKSAQMDENAFTPDTVKALASDVLILIASL